MKAFLLYGTLSLLSIYGYSQASDSASTGSKTNFVIGAAYNSAINYYGRTDSLNSKAFIPFAGINFRNGIYINASFAFISNELATKYAASIVETGYRFKNKKENWTGNIFVNGFFYDKQSGLVQSALKGSAGINLSHTNKILNLNVGGDVKWSDAADFTVFAGLDHIFRTERLGPGVLVIDPSVYLYAGTQRFTETYYQDKQFLLFPAGQEAITRNSSRFNLLSYELSCPVVYGYKKVQLIVNPSYVIPENLVSVPGRPDLSEQGTNLFYIVTAIRFTL
jgi:hypothetical protein